jgi:hypothetical protein
MLDPATVQILFADLQPPIVARSKTNPPQSLSCAASVLARCARLLGLPVHHSVVPEGGKAPEVPPGSPSPEKRALRPVVCVR